MKSICAKAAGSVRNKFKYNGKEQQNEEFSDGSGLELYDYGARFFDPQLGRWNTIDRYADKMRLYSPYTYAFDNPVSIVDENGKWPKWIHHRIIQQAFQGILNKHQIDKLIEASDNTDKKPNQTAANDKKHYMAQPGENEDESTAEAEEFIKDQQNLYLIAATDDAALEALGAGMHTLMDKTSPAHRGKHGPKKWAGNFGSKIVFVFYHFWAEANIFHLSERRVQEAVDNIRLYYFNSLEKKLTSTVTVGPLEPNPAPSPTPPLNPIPDPPPVPTQPPAQ
jgi:RHS repeat-associated protein